MLNNAPWKLVNMCWSINLWEKTSPLHNGWDPIPLQTKYHRSSPELIGWVNARETDSFILKEWQQPVMSLLQITMVYQEDYHRPRHFDLGED